MPASHLERSVLQWLIVRVTDSDAASGSDAVALISPATSETGSGQDAGTIAATVSGSETGSGSDAVRSTGPSSLDTGSGQDTVALIGPRSSDTGSGQDTVSPIRPSSADTGRGTDAARIAASLAGSDIGTGQDRIVSVPVGFRAPPAQRNPFTYPAWDLVAGEPLDTLPYTGVTFGAPLNQPGSWQGQISLAALSSAAVAAANAAGSGPQFGYTRATSCSNTALFVDFAGRLVWGGILWTSDYDSSDPQKLLKVGASEFGSYFQQRLQAEDYSATWAAGQDPMLIAQQVLEDALSVGNVMGGITLRLNPAAGESGPRITPSYPGTSLQTIDSIVQILSQMGYSVGFDYTFDCAYLPGTRTPAVTLNFWYPRKGRRASENQLVLLSKDCTFTYSIDGTQQATAITETGSGVGTVVPATASVELPGYPLLERTFNRSQINDDGTLSAVTLGDLGLYCFPVVSPKFTIPVALPGEDGRIPADAPMPLGSFDRGDDFDFRVDPVAGGGENTDPRFPEGCRFEWRINSWQCTVADKGLSTIQLTGGVPPLATIPPPLPPL